MFVLRKRTFDGMTNMAELLLLFCGISVVLGEFSDPGCFTRLCNLSRRESKTGLSDGGSGFLRLFPGWIGDASGLRKYKIIQESFGQIASDAGEMRLGLKR
ncbi:hypothetical protein RRG08_019215 [Elysia crispata]|uniref:Secreted protein n=1 Tax=Elysia crispata TaxID=231223 RepID=A0AAE1ATC3_9GAST|nr:hypothetical protein RRG08_019215 [Elysia crispata]